MIDHENPSLALVQALLRLRLLTTSRNAVCADDAAARLQLYADRLARWDQEIVLLALDHWPPRSKWWPSWHEPEQDLLALDGRPRTSPIFVRP